MRYWELDHVRSGIILLVVDRIFVYIFCDENRTCFSVLKSMCLIQKKRMFWVRNLLPSRAVCPSVPMAIQASIKVFTTCDI